MSIDTKAKILDAAEALFANKGFAATSLRDITTEADVNLAAVNYHFGSKLDLLRAVFSRRLGPVNAERLELFDALHEPDIEQVLLAFFGPLFTRLREPGSGWTKFMQLAGRTHTDTNDEIRSCLLEQIQEVAARFIDSLRATVPDLPPAVFSARVHFIFGAMAHTIAFCQHKDMPLVDTLPEPDAILEDLVDFAIAGLRAPVGSAVNNRSDNNRSHD